MSKRGREPTSVRYPIIAACRHARIKDTRDTLVHDPKLNRLCVFGKCQNVTRYCGVDVKAAAISATAKRRKRLQALYARFDGQVLPAQPRLPEPKSMLPMCKECFNFALWHINHKWNILALLSRSRPEISRDVWSHIEKYLWILK